MRGFASRHRPGVWILLWGVTIAAELGRLDGLLAVEGVVGMGGAVTNLAAVKHGLAV